MKKGMLRLGIVVLILGLLFLIVVKPRIKAWREPSEEVMLSNLKANVIRKCQGDKPTPEKIAFCECAGEEIVKQLGVSELKDLKTYMEYAEKTIFPECMKKTNAWIPLEPDSSPFKEMKSK